MYVLTHFTYGSAEHDIKALRCLARCMLLIGRLGLVMLWLPEATIIIVCPCS